MESTAPRGWTHRTYHGDADLHRLLGALSQAHINQPATNLMHPGDLIWALFQNTQTDPRETIELWESADGDLVGFGFFEGGDFETQYLASTGEWQQDFEREALAVARERARQADVAMLRTEILDSDAVQRDLLTAAGFALDETRMTSRGERYTGMLRLRQALDQGAEVADTNARFIVRPVGGEEEWEERVNLHRTVWAPSRVSLEAYRRLRAAPVYRPDLDLVAVAPDGTFAAYAIVWYDPASHVGEFEPVGTHPTFRRQGAARAVMLEGLRRLRELGARRALVTSSADNPASIRLYESVGFSVGDQGRFYAARL